MTVGEYINSFHSCAINSIPLNEVLNVLNSVPIPATRLDDYEAIVNIVKNDKKFRLNLRFADGKFANYMTITKYNRNMKQFALDSVVHFSSLDVEPIEEESDMDMDMLIALC